MDAAIRSIQPSSRKLLICSVSSTFSRGDPPPFLEVKSNVFRLAAQSWQPPSTAYGRTTRFSRLRPKDEILCFIEEFSSSLEIPIIYVSHAMDEIIRLADTMVVVSEGQIAATGSVEDITSRLDLRPMTGRYEAGSVIRTIIADHDKRNGLTLLEFVGGKFTVPKNRAHRSNTSPSDPSQRCIGCNGQAARNQY